MGNCAYPRIIVAPSFISPTTHTLKYLSGSHTVRVFYIIFYFSSGPCGFTSSLGGRDTLFQPLYFPWERALLTQILFLCLPYRTIIKTSCTWFLLKSHLMHLIEIVPALRWYAALS
jgi:hypothetical protein